MFKPAVSIDMFADEDIPDEVSGGHATNVLWLISGSHKSCNGRVDGCYEHFDER